MFLLLDEVLAYQGSFEESEFYHLIEDGSEAAILKALDLVTQKQVNVALVSHKDGTQGWNYVHYMIDRYLIKESNPRTAPTHCGTSMRY